MTFETLHNDMVAAMKARDKERKAVLSTLIADVKKAAIDAGTREDISEALVDQVILKSLKTAKDPHMMSEAEIRQFLADNFAALLETKNKGQIMKEVMPALKGKADGKLINQVVAEMCK